MKLSLQAALFACLSSGPAAAACTLSADASPQAVSVRYDPFSPAQQTLDLAIRFRNSGDACQARLYLRPPAGANLTAGGSNLAYRLDGQIGPGLPRAGELGPFVALVPANGDAEIRVQAVIPAQQVVSPGSYTGDLELRADDQDGEEIRLRRSLTRLEANVPGRAEMSISGTAASNISAAEMAPASIDFPNAQTGQSERVFVNVWANGSVTVSLESANGGVLKHLDNTDLPPVTYTLNFDGSPVPGGVQTFGKTPPMSLSGASYELAVTLGDLSRNFGGRYRDVITVTVDQN